MYPIGTKIIYTIQENGAFFEVILPKQDPQEFEGNLIKAILEYEQKA